MTDRQIANVLFALGIGFLATDWIGDAIAALAGRSGVTGYAGIALALLIASAIVHGRDIGHRGLRRVFGKPVKSREGSDQ